MSALKSRTHGPERGFALVEVMVSAALLVVVATGVFAGIDGPGATSSMNQSKSVAATLAQQDQDRMRAYRFTDLSNYQPAPTQKVVGGVTYTVTSKAEWATDSSGSLSCTSGSQANYLKLTSTVSWPGAGSNHPFSLDSMMAPPPSISSASQGNLSIWLTDQANNNVAGVPVTLNSGSNPTLATNALGCAFFGDLAVGNYNVSFAQPGYVDPAGLNTVTLQNQGVTAGVTNVQQHQYAQAAQVAVTFDTVKPGTSQSIAAPPTTVTVHNTNIPPNSSWPTGQNLSFPGTTAPVNLQLFPFTSADAIFAGGCLNNNPNLINSSYTQNLVQLQPGTSYAFTAREPMIDVTLTRGGSPYTGPADVVIKAIDSGCTGTFKQSFSGGEAQFALPFGNYSVCADDTTKFWSGGNVADTSAGGVSKPVNITSGGTSGVCQ